MISERDQPGELENARSESTRRSKSNKNKDGMGISESESPSRCSGRTAQGDRLQMGYASVDAHIDMDGAVIS